MPRLTKIEREALAYVVNDVQAGDSWSYFNNGCEVPDHESEHDAEHKKAVRLAVALESAAKKLKL